jgi:hypothetical protein
VTGSSQTHRLMTTRLMPCPQRPAFFSGKLTNGQVSRLIFCMPLYRCAKAFSEKPVATLDEQSAEVFATALVACSPPGSNQVCFYLVPPFPGRARVSSRECGNPVARGIA